MSTYQVIVGNIGTVYEGSLPVTALGVYGEYKRQSKAGHGRAAGESVTILKNNEIWVDHPAISLE